MPPLNNTTPILRLFLTAVLLAFLGSGSLANHSNIVPVRLDSNGQVSPVSNATGEEKKDAFSSETQPFESYFLKTATTVAGPSARNESISLGEAFFSSFFRFSRLPLTTAFRQGSGLYFKRQQQQLIFPYHYFW